MHQETTVFEIVLTKGFWWTKKVDEVGTKHVGNEETNQWYL